MGIKYCTDRSTQILIALLKAHGIKKVVASPGTTNAIFVASIQNDNDFECYSSVDERSAAYIACGMAQASGEPVVITCTEATASRNYLPGLTEAYYRKLPILVITGFHDLRTIGHLAAQAIDRSTAPKDTVVYSTTISHCNNREDEWYVNTEINKAILELTRHGGGPVHINLQFPSRWDFYTENLPQERVIKRITYGDKFPDLPKGRIGIGIGSHKKFSKEEIKRIEKFCEVNNAVVYSNLVCGYYGKYRVSNALIGIQKNKKSTIMDVDLLIYLGEIGVPGANAKQCWRISEDGEIRDPFKYVSNVFEISVYEFFKNYSEHGANLSNTYYDECSTAYQSLINDIPELPFSNAWIAKTSYSDIPHDSIIHFGILNSFRVWNFFKIDESIETSCNFGGFGIDGGMSTLIGSSLARKNQIHFGIFGDLAFFYDMNSLGNRHVGNNFRILLINNGKGNEFRNSIHPAYKLGEFADTFIAASGHYGNKSKNLVRHYAQDLGYIYMSATTKEEYLSKYKDFFSDNIKDAPVIFEVFTDGEAESVSLDILSNINGEMTGNIIDKAKKFVRNVVGDEGVVKLLKIFGK